MRRKPLALVMISLMILSVFLAGCRRKSASPPLDELTTDEEAAAAMLEAQANTEETQETVEATPATTEEPTEVPSDTPEPTEGIVEATPEPTATTAPVVEPVTEEPTAEPTITVSSSATTHVVRPGENLFRISLQYGTTVQALSQANNITNPGMIYVGQTLQIPAGTGTTTSPTIPGQTSCATVYVVQPGDNLFRIALRYNYSQAYLAQHNGIANPSLVYIGQQICIP